MKRAICFFFCLLFFGNSFAGEIRGVESDSAFYNMSLEQLMNINVSVTSRLPTNSREAAGIVSVISADEIKKTGAQDLMQILQMVPGFDFGVDVDGVVGIGIRGNWAHEGKALLIIDGMEMNEDLYNTLQFVHHYPVERIKRIEIIRGPGSAKYGGNAEYAVINVITGNNCNFNGLSTDVTNSWMSRTFGYRHASIAAGKSFGNAHINASTALSEANQSQDIYTDYKNESYDMARQSRIANEEYRVDFFLNNFSFTGYSNLYSIEQRDGYDEIFKRSYNTHFYSSFLNAKYDILGNKGLIITPGIKFKYQQPWKFKDEIKDDIFKPFCTSSAKTEYYIISGFEPTSSINIEAGINYYNQRARDQLDSGFFSNGKKEFIIDNYSAYLQSSIRTKPFNIIFGSRYNFNPYYEHSLLPRVGITRVFEKWHLKALYSKAFKTPSVENIEYGKDIHPENTTVIEFETGVKLSPSSYLTTNIFRINTINPIIYGYDDNLNDYYINDSCTGTKGFEIEYKLKLTRFFTSLNYSYYDLKKEDEGHSSIYYLPGAMNQNLAFAKHKLNCNINFAVSRTMNINFSERFFSKRISYSENNLGIVTLTEYHPKFYSDITFSFENVIAKGLRLQASVLNLFDEKVIYIQPYKGNHEPLPGASREILLRASYSF